MMKMHSIGIRAFQVCCMAACMLICGSALRPDGQGEWTHFRGSRLTGIATGQSFPTHWNDSSGIDWKAEIKGRGWSSPVVYGDQIWCTTASTDGRWMTAVCVDFNSGKIRFMREVFRPDTLYRKHSINTYATPTPCIEAGFVYVHFGRYGTACIETENGTVVWRRDDLQCRHVQGPGSSPVLYEDLLILHFEGTDQRYLVALDKASGKTRWKVSRPSEPYVPLKTIAKKAYITPLIMKVKGRDLLISNGSAVCIAYEPATGREVWRVVNGAESTIAMPVESGGLVFYHSGFMVSPDGEKYAELMAVDPSGEGDVTATHVRWKIKTPPLQLATPVISGGLIYTIDARALLSCIDAENGETIWSEQLKGKFNSSPVLADGKIYFSSTNGETYVIRAGRRYDLLAKNQTEGEIWATPAFLRGSILLRTSEGIYKIQ